MFIAYLAIATLLTLALTFSAVFTARRAEPVISNMRAVAVPDSWLPGLAAAKAAGAAGLVIGFWIAPLGMAAAVGLALYFVGAVATHVRVKHYAFAPAAVLLMLSVASLLLRIASA
ncbi:DoxX family protein [Streptomyces sp. NBC_00536]|uniref:DoxX family protein n=1 Tax=Streptomyces sp. NBC_00536 TaxID=2975769 RepID=UPI002E7FEDC0|nr:DoxX family protein [Streptomyces sp. NBC_00536]WUC78903.1 DoxX family protein [Streptomyces sp. NBC_00536]